MSKKECINSQRLEKLFSSNRDLTLSSSKKNNQMRSQTTTENKKKKAVNFVPNLINVRSKAESLKTDLNGGTKDEAAKAKRGNKEKEQRAPFKRGNNLIQTVGVFSEGFGATNHQRRHESSRSTRESLNDESIQRPRIIKQEETSKKNDVQVLANLIGGGDFTEDDFKSNLTDPFNPIKIRKFNEVKEESMIDKTVKKEPIDYELDQKHNPATVSFNQKPSSPHAQFHMIKGQFNELFERNSSDLMMFQFPDALPGKIIENDEEKDEKLELTSKLQVKSNVPKLFSLQNLSEGLIGKVVRYRSGKIKFFLGDSVSYNVECGIPAELQQHVAVIDTCAEERSTNIYSLGLITSKHIISPDWNSIWP